jgi:histidinol-phosphate phosphatase family protein
MIQVVVLAGGSGTRLKAVTGALPKPLARANGRPLLDLQLTLFASNGVQEVLVLTGYGADQIASYCGDGSAWGLSVRCVPEPHSLGTAGAVSHAKSLLASEFMVIYGDTVFDFDLARITAVHRSGDQMATLLLHPNDHPHDSDLVEVDGSDRIVAFHPYPRVDQPCLPNLVNAGVYVLSRHILDWWEGLPERPDFGKHVFPHLLESGQYLQGYRSPEYIKDAGTPDRLSQVSKDLASGRVARQSLREPTSAVFLDRDGTINQEKEGRVVRPEDMQLITGAGAAIARLNASDYRTVVVTNQAVVARGDCSEETLQLIHNCMETLLGAQKAFIDRIYYCPHIPERGFPGERTDLKIRCGCRKPEIGMLTRAASDLNLELRSSWMVGDSTGDVETAHRAGLKSILLSTGLGGHDGKWLSQPDAECLDLADAVNFILDRWPAMLLSLRPVVSRISSGSVVMIAGQARAGKSQYAAALRRSLEAAGMPAVVICLDNWLKAETERVGNSVLDRFDLESAAQFLRQAASGGRFLLSRYDRRNRRQVADALEMHIPPGTVLIVEGVPALASPQLSSLGHHRIAVLRNEEDRRAAMRRDYALRGWPEQKIEQLIAERIEEEFPTIQASLANADTTLNSGFEP